MPRSVNCEDVAGRPPHDVLGDCSLDEPLEEALAAHADDDQVDVTLLGELDDRLRGLAARRAELGLEPALAEDRARLLEPLDS